MALLDIQGRKLQRSMSMFPSFIDFQLPDNGGVARLHFTADGSCHGDGNENGLQDVLDAIGALPAGPDLPMVWLLANAVRRQMKDIEAADEPSFQGL